MLIRSLRRWPAWLTAFLFSAALVPASAAVDKFDSVAEFSDTQGANGWQYGYYSRPGEASSFTPLSYYNVTWTNGWSEGTSNPPWTTLWDKGGHPNGPNSGEQHDAVRRWSSGAAGTVTLVGDYAMGHFGTTALSVLVDGRQIWAGQTDSASQRFSTSFAVGLGSKIDFVINSNGDDYGDSTVFTVSGLVTAVPEPTSATLLLGGLMAVGALRIGRRRLTN